MKSYSEEYIADFKNFEQDFENITHQSITKKATLRVPLLLFEYVKQITGRDLKSLVDSSKYSSNISLVATNKLRIDYDIIRNVFKPTNEKVISVIRKVLTDYKEAHNVMDIIMVGELADCPLLQEDVKACFPEKRIIAPSENEYAILRGAVICGHQPCQYIRISQSEDKSESILTKLSQLNSDDFKNLVALGTFASYENRVYLAGPCNIGKSSLASILIGETIPKNWVSTDGLIIHFGRNGINLEQRKMIPLKTGT
ncbi:unnamed protein product [Mytilus edulis]|uniref:Uncharacterized protein n=1 Tax=Mytilus edulis TaxID=6550 RepID=A0A8S3UG73_MYTED|nr:unnamed protein product [Mytilus edulis]